MPKLIVIIVGIGLLLAGLLAFLTSRGTSTDTKIAQTTKNPRTSVAKARSQVPTTTPFPSISMQKTTIEGISFSLPTDWKAAKAPVQGNEVLVAAFPTKNAADDLVPHVYTRKQDRKKTSAELEAVKLRGVGFQQLGTAQIAGVSAKEYNIVMPGDSFIKGNPQKKDVLQTIYLFEKNNAVYQVDVAYFNDSTREQIEDLITQIASSISL